MFDLSNGPWSDAINDEMQARNLRILLIASTGNTTFSYNGSEALAELIRQGQVIEWARTVIAIKNARHWRLRGALLSTVGPWFPRWAWKLLCAAYYGSTNDVRKYSMIEYDRLKDLDLLSRANTNGIDLSYRPSKDGLATRLTMLSDIDPGNFYKGTLAGWGIDARDPTGDRRLIEFCLSVPTEQYFRNGVPRALARAALADRVPPEVLNEKRRGYQAVDWHEGLTSARPQLLDELARLEQVPAAARALDLPRMRRLAENWPTEGWERPEIIEQYRLALLRGVSVGHFLATATRAARAEFSALQNPHLARRLRP